MPVTRDLERRLAALRTIDLTTRGRRSGRPSRIEIWWFHIEGDFVITGTPGRRDWYANVLAYPGVVVHSPFGDHPATAEPVTDVGRRRRVMTDPATSWYSTQADLDRLVDESPMIVVRLT